MDEAAEADLEAEASRLRADLADRNRDRVVRLARLSRRIFWLAVVLLAALAVAWIFGLLETATAGFRVLALGVVVSFGLAFLTGALSAAAERRGRPG